MADPSAGEVGGIFAGAVALFVALGHGIKWWLGWTDRRAATRSAKLDAWQQQLDERERRLDGQQAEHWKQVELQLGQLRREHAALRGGYQLIAGALRLLDPESPALHRADELLKAAWPLEPLTPSDMQKVILSVDRSPLADD